MLTSDTAKLRAAWRAKGEPPCDHPKVVKERHDLGADTGDFVCTTCGEAWWRETAPDEIWESSGLTRPKKTS